MITLPAREPGAGSTGRISLRRNDASLRNGDVFFGDG
jgi:hypothetical protein